MGTVTGSPHRWASSMPPQGRRRTLWPLSITLRGIGWGAARVPSWRATASRCLAPTLSRPCEQSCAGRLTVRSMARGRGSGGPDRRCGSQLDTASPWSTFSVLTIVHALSVGSPSECVLSSTRRCQGLGDHRYRRTICNDAPECGVPGRRALGQVQSGLAGNPNTEPIPGGTTLRACETDPVTTRPGCRGFRFATAALYAFACRRVRWRAPRLRVRSRRCGVAAPFVIQVRRRV